MLLCQSTNGEEFVRRARARREDSGFVPHQKMHTDEVEIGDDLVRRLLTEQFPQWSTLPLARVESAGTDNAIFRLGDDLAVRLPRIG